jgi:hypothetical protein
VQEITSDPPSREASIAQQQAQEREATRQQMLLEQQQLRRQQQQQKRLGSSIAIPQAPVAQEEEPTVLSFIGSVWQVCVCVWQPLQQVTAARY